MSLDTVVEDIRDEARAREQEILQDAEERADEIIEEANHEAEEIREEQEAEVDAQIEQEREQKLSSAKLEAKQARLEARRDILEDVREDVEDDIADLSGSTREELTEALLDAAAAEFESGATLDVFGRADDKSLLKDLVEDEANYEYAGEVDCLGGVVVESDASRIRVNNTFDSVLEDVWEDNLREISDRLFEQ